MENVVKVEGKEFSYGLYREISMYLKKSYISLDDIRKVIRVARSYINSIIKIKYNIEQKEEEISIKLFKKLPECLNHEEHLAVIDEIYPYARTDKCTYPNITHNVENYLKGRYTEGLLIVAKIAPKRV